MWIFFTSAPRQRNPLSSCYVWPLFAWHVAAAAVQLGWETVKAAYHMLARDAEKLRESLAQPRSATSGMASPVPKAFAVKRVGKKTFDGVRPCHAFVATVIDAPIVCLPMHTISSADLIFPRDTFCLPLSRARMTRRRVSLRRVNPLPMTPLPARACLHPRRARTSVAQRRATCPRLAHRTAVPPPHGRHPHCLRERMPRTAPSRSRCLQHPLPPRAVTCPGQTAPPRRLPRSLVWMSRPPRTACPRT